MTLFGQTIDAQQLFSLISLIAMLGLWLAVLSRQRRHARDLKRWKQEQAAREAAQSAPEPSAPEPGPGTGPWG
ncbi:hypothetical protein [Brevundimonas diminuta]|uniref:hypothetical protein n=1 Tax=Brevundimonas diminuta TaxID=293 RepID=UPI003D01DBF8